MTTYFLRNWPLRKFLSRFSWDLIIYILFSSIQRRDYSALVKFLPPKYEYVISVRLSPLQIKLYEKYLELHRNNPNNLRGASLFSDYQALMRIWTHPWVLKMDEIRQEKKVCMIFLFVYIVRSLCSLSFSYRVCTGPWIPWTCLNFSFRYAKVLEFGKRVRKRPENWK